MKTENPETGMRNSKPLLVVPRRMAVMEDATEAGRRSWKAKMADGDDRGDGGTGG
jgi:hypothetical protein